MSEFLGCTISLISNSDIRYVGILEEIDSQASTVSLKNVRSHGTEDRRSDPAEQIPSSEQIYEFIVFRGADVKDLNVMTDTSLPNDPAIIGAKPRAGGRNGGMEVGGPGRVGGPGGLGSPGPNGAIGSNGHLGSAGFGQNPWGTNVFMPSPMTGGWGRGAPAPGAFYPPPHGWMPTPPFGGPGPWGPNPGGFPGANAMGPGVQGPPGPHGPPGTPGALGGPPPGSAGPPGPINRPVPGTNMPSAPVPPASSGVDTPGSSGPPISSALSAAAKPVAAGFSPASKPDTQAPKAVAPPSLPTESRPSGADPKTAIHSTPTSNTTNMLLQASNIPAASSAAATRPVIPVVTTFTPPVTVILSKSDKTVTKESATSTVADVTESARAAIASAMSRMEQLSTVSVTNVTTSQPSSAMDNLTRKVHEMRMNSARGGGQMRGGNYSRGGGQTRGRGGLRGSGRGGSRMPLPDTDFDFASSNAKLSKEELAKELSGVGKNIESSDAPSSSNENNQSVAYDKSVSFFDNISSEAKDRAENGAHRLGGREWRGEELRRNIETFGSPSVDNSHRANFRRGGRGRGGSRGRGGGGRGRGRNGTSQLRAPSGFGCDAQYASS